MQKYNPDFQKFIKLEYEIMNDGEENYLAGIFISDIDVFRTIDYYLNDPKVIEANSKVLNYCIDRIVRYNNIHDPKSWKIDFLEYYYGKEVDGVFLKKHNDIINEIKRLLTLNDAKRIEYALFKEYGYLLPSIKNARWNVKNIPYSSVVMYNVKHMKNLDKQLVDEYQKHSLPKCIVVPVNGNKYRLIDGYHRFCAAKDHDTIEVIARK